MGIVTSLFGGRPGMISGATGAVAIVLVSLAASHGPEFIFATVVLAGCIQVLAGLFRLGKFMRLVPQPVIYGFVNGLAIIIFLSQMTQFQDGSGQWLSGAMLYSLLGLVGITMLIIAILPRFTRAFPAPLASILVVFAVVYFGNIDTQTVGDLADIA